MIDPMGRLRDTLNLGRLGVVDTPLPAALAPTPYAHFGDLIFAALLLAALGGAVLLARKEAR
jgi:apolipoprotein N-acyltransferase